MLRIFLAILVRPIHPQGLMVPRWRKQWWWSQQRWLDYWWLQWWHGIHDKCATSDTPRSWCRWLVIWEDESQLGRKCGMTQELDLTFACLKSNHMPRPRAGRRFSGARAFLGTLDNQIWSGPLRNILLTAERACDVIDWCRSRERTSKRRAISAQSATIA